VNPNHQQFSRDRLDVRVFADKAAAGAAGAEIAAGIIRAEIARAGRAAVVFASAVSQDPFLAALRTHQIDWPRLTAFHMDEYAGMSADQPRSGSGIPSTGW
jgi:glucosamine-6-phosphate deaminase